MMHGHLHGRLGFDDAILLAFHMQEKWFHFVQSFWLLLSGGSDFDR